MMLMLLERKSNSLKLFRGKIQQFIGFYDKGLIVTEKNGFKEFLNLKF